MKWVVFASSFLLPMAFTGLLFADPPTEPAATDPKITQDAELRLLRSSVDRQQKENAALKARVAELTAQLLEFGIAPVGSTTQPATAPQAKPKRVVFVLDCYYMFSWGRRKPDPYDEVIKAVNELSADQWFNVVFRPHPWGDPLVLQKNMLPANDLGKEQAKKFLKRDLSPSPDALPSMALAIKWKPDLIWYVGAGSEQTDKFLADVQKLNASAKVKINTTTQFWPGNTSRVRFLWQLAHDSGGICLDENGQPLAEPPAAVKVELPKPPPPPTRPSILRNP